ncbi:hypothetical protein B0H11DRAFT_1940028 [Mycena galericulata]|nr:hypothetical protein B0H11DRAFT_1940028 [Mycena galericulata]
MDNRGKHPEGWRYRRSDRNRRRSHGDDVRGWKVVKCSNRWPLQETHRPPWEGSEAGGRNGTGGPRTCRECRGVVEWLTGGPHEKAEGSEPNGGVIQYRRRGNIPRNTWKHTEVPRRSAEGWNVSRESLEEEQMTTESIVGKGRRAGGRNGPRWKNMMELVMFRKGRTGPEQGGCVGEAGTSGYCRECGRWKGVEWLYGKDQWSRKTGGSDGDLREAPDKPELRRKCRNVHGYNSIPPLCSLPSRDIGRYEGLLEGLWRRQKAPAEGCKSRPEKKPEVRRDRRGHQRTSEKCQREWQKGRHDSGAKDRRRYGVREWKGRERQLWKRNKTGRTGGSAGPRKDVEKVPEEFGGMKDIIPDRRTGMSEDRRSEDVQGMPEGREGPEESPEDP